VALQHKFAAVRRKQRLQSQPGLIPKELEVANDKLGLPVSHQNPVTKPAKPLSQKGLRQQRRLIRVAQRQKAKQDRRETHKAKEAAEQGQNVLDWTEGKKLSAPAVLESSLESRLQHPTTVSGPQEVHEDMPADDHSNLGPLGKDEGPARKVMSKKPVTRTRKVMSTTPKRGEDRLSETERKADLARKLGVKIHKHRTGDNPHHVAQAERRRAGGSKSQLSGTPLSDLAGFDSLQGALGRKGAKLKTAIEKADATQLEILRES